MSPGDIMCWPGIMGASALQITTPRVALVAAPTEYSPETNCSTQKCLGLLPLRKDSVVGRKRRPSSMMWKRSAGCRSGSSNLTRIPLLRVAHLMNFHDKFVTISLHCSNSRLTSPQRTTCNVWVGNRDFYTFYFRLR